MVGTTEERSARGLEIGHVLFVDIVGWSTRPTDQQREILEDLVETVQSSRIFIRSLSSEQLVRVPSGDGMALIFTGDPENPARLALHLSQELLTRKYEIRMALHTGPIMRMVDINMKENVAGSGINNAKRVLDLGLPNQILCSGEYASLLLELSQWEGYLHRVGKAVVKHGVEIDVFNLYSETFGNPESPVLRTPLERAPVATESALKDSSPKNLVIIYRRRCTPDQHVLTVLERGLQELGHQVFVDTHLTIGVPWAQHIRQKISEADAVIALISMDSLMSEMLAQELETTHRFSSKSTDGRPHILPVRIGYEGAYPTSVDPYLGGVQYFMWESPDDDRPMLDSLSRTLSDLDMLKMNGEEPLNSPIDLPSMSKESGGGAVGIDSPFYIKRDSDDEFLAAIDQKQSIVLAKGARQMGKTSMLVRAIDLATRRGWDVVSTDFQKISDDDLGSAESIYRALANSICLELNLEADPDDEWNDKKSPSMNFERYLRRFVFPAIDDHLVWCLDEADRLLISPAGGEIFALFRSWHNERATKPNGPWAKLTQAFAYATEAQLFIKDLNQSPFNVGIHLTLQDFSFSQVRELNKKYGNPVEEGQLADIVRLLNGHPYLLRRCLYLMAAGKMTLTEFEFAAVEDDGPIGDHLKRIIFLLAKDPELTADLRQVLQGKSCPSEDSFYRLRSAGVLIGENVRMARVRCDVYQRFLARHLL